MYQFVWAKEVLNYLKDNKGLVDKLELAFADLRETIDGMPPRGLVDENVSSEHYLWTIHEHAILIRTGTEDEQLKLWIETIKPVEPKSKTSTG